MQITRKDDFGKLCKIEISTINKAVCVFITRESRVYREAFTKEEALQIGNELIKQAEDINV